MADQKEHSTSQVKVPSRYLKNETNATSPGTGSPTYASALRRLSGVPPLATVFENDKEVHCDESRDANEQNGANDKRKILQKSHSKGPAARQVSFEEDGSRFALERPLRVGSRSRSNSLDDAEEKDQQPVAEWIDSCGVARQASVGQNSTGVADGPWSGKGGPQPTKHMSVTSEDTDNTGFNSQSEQCLEDDLHLGAEAHHLSHSADGQSPEATHRKAQPSLSQSSGPSVFGSLDSKARRSLYSSSHAPTCGVTWQNNSFSSEVSGHTGDSAQSGVSSIDLLLNRNKKDPAEILENLGFGSREPKGMLSRLPARFLHADSCAQGIELERFIDAHDDIRDYIDIAHMSASKGQLNANRRTLTSPEELSHQLYAAHGVPLRFLKTESKPEDLTPMERTRSESFSNGVMEKLRKRRLRKAKSIDLDTTRLNKLNHADRLMRKTAMYLSQDSGNHSDDEDSGKLKKTDFVRLDTDLSTLNNNNNKISANDVLPSVSFLNPDALDSAV